LAAATASSLTAPGDTRDADFRILLPTAPPHTAVCFGASRIANALGRVGVSVLGQSEATAVDLAVVCDPRPARLHAAAAALRPGGAVYVETRLAFFFGRSRLTRRLRRAGLVDPAIFWRSRARRGATSAWVPVGASGPVEHFLARRDGHGFRRRLAAWLFLLARRADMLAPLAAVARKPRDGSVDADEGVLEFLAGHWQNVTGIAATPRLSWLVLAPGTRSISKIVAFVFLGSEPYPRLVVKSGRTPLANAALEREGVALRSLGARPAGPPPGTPSCVLLERRADGGAVLVETVVHGTPLYRTLTSETFHRLGFRAAEWLAALVDHSDGAPGRVSRAIEALLPEVRGRLVDATLEQGLRRLAASADAAPAAFEQRDFAPWNLVLDSAHGLGVLDWESAEPDGFPLLDLVYFLTNCGFLLDGADSVEACVRSYRRTRDAASRSGAAAQACIEAYAARTALPEDSVPGLRALTWLVHLCSAARGVGSSPQLGRLPTGPVLFAALLREELA
jgi:hypothetical protein